MIIAIGVMFVTSLLLAAAFTVAEGEIATTHRDTTKSRPTTPRSRGAGVPVRAPGQPGLLGDLRRPQKQRARRDHRELRSDRTAGEHRAERHHDAKPRTPSTR